jgi:hypothetical protein
MEFVMDKSNIKVDTINIEEIIKLSNIIKVGLKRKIGVKITRS